MGRLAVPAEDGERLVLWRSREREEAQICLTPTLRHAPEQFFKILAPFLSGTPPGLLKELLAAQHFLEVCCGLAPLRTVGLVEDDSAVLRNGPREYARSRSNASIRVYIGRCLTAAARSGSPFAN